MRIARSEPSRSAAVFVTIVLLTIVVGIISYDLIEWRRTLSIETDATRFTLQRLLVTIVDEESGLRGFAATGEHLFLQPYYSGRQQFAANLALGRRQARAAHLREVEAALDRIAQLHDRWIRDVAGPVIQSRGVVPQLHAEALGKSLMDEMRREIAGADSSAARALGSGGLVVQFSIVGSITTIVVLTSILGAAALRSERARSKREGDFVRRLAASNDELKRQRASVLALNQLKNDLIAVLAHDIKGPLTSIGGFAELLADGALSGSAAADAARMIGANARQLATLTDDVLTLSRIEHGELDISEDRIDLVELVRSVALGHSAERTISIASTVDRALVRGDADRLRQVFENLLRNAIKYSPSDKPIDVTIDASAERVSVGVRDYGMGIPPGDLPRLFRRFARASNARQAKIAGTGIGLFIVKMLVERHGGSVAVESTPGEGSLFTVTLPPVDASVTRRPMCVTILTEDTDLSGFAAFELRSRGYRVHECRSLPELVQSGDLYPGDVLLVDEDIAGIAEVRRSIPTEGIRLVGLRAGSSNHAGWDMTLTQPLLVSDLIAAVKGDTAAAAPRG